MLMNTVGLVDGIFERELAGSLKHGSEMLERNKG